MCLYFISIFNQIDFIFLSLNSKCIKKINVNFMIFLVYYETIHSKYEYFLLSSQIIGE